jgi:ferredoxin--NADP+ reductase
MGDAIGTDTRPLHVVIVGTGPSGFFAAQALTRARDVALRIDLLDRLPTPFGLVRGGVAPDHASIKNIAKRFSRVAEDPRVRFFGNVQVGRDVSVDELRRRYDAVVLAIGAESSQRLGVPGEDLDGVASATDFVAWYNGHPDRAGFAVDLTRTRRVHVVGNGNVALDVARVLGSPVETFAPTDIADAALAALRGSAVEDVTILGRRGPVQAAFTNPELRELHVRPGLSLRVDPDDLVLAPACAAALEAGGPTSCPSRNLALLREVVKQPPPEGRPIRLRFCLSPVAFLGDEGGRLRAIRLQRNRLEPDGDRIRAVPDGEPWDEPCELALTAIGYRGVPVPGVPFDARAGHVANADGRVVEDGAVVDGLYVVGWAKRGPTGVIGTNKPDSGAVVGGLLEDLVGAPGRALAGDLAALLTERGVQAVDWPGWERLDAVEVAAGAAQGRPRVKRTTWDALLDAIR